MKQGKYIVILALDDINNRRLEAILFSNTIAHKTVAQMISDDVVSAGFFRVGAMDVDAWGGSESLQIPGCGDLDHKYVRRALGLDDSNLGPDRLTDYRQGLELVQARRAQKKR